MKNKQGEIAWGLLATYVLIYDLIALKRKYSTLSSCFYRATTHKSGRVLLIAFWFYLTAHLFRWLPKKWDLFRALV